MTKSVVVAALFIFAASGVSQARWHNLSMVGLKVDVPKAWKVDSQGDLILAMPSTQDVMVAFWEFSGAGSMDAAMEELDKELDRFIQDPEIIGEPTVTTINGLDAVLIDGKGKAEGQAIEWSVGAIDNGKGKILLLLGFAEPAAVKKYARQIEGILKSIKK